MHRDSRRRLHMRVPVRLLTNARSLHARSIRSVTGAKAQVRSNAIADSITHDSSDLCADRHTNGSTNGCADSHTDSSTHRHTYGVPYEYAHRRTDRCTYSATD